MEKDIYIGLKSNIWKIAASNILFSFGLIGAIYILFFQFLGYNFNQIGIFEAFTSITIILIDLPSGSLADLIGRKWTVLIANSFMVIMALILIFSSGSILSIVLAGIFSGLEFSFKSGASSALLYDTMRQLNRENDFLKVSGRLNSIYLIVRLIGLPLGSILFVVDPRLPYWIWIILIGFSLIFIVIIREPVKSEQKRNFGALFQNMKASVRFVFENKKLLWYTVFFLFACVFTESYWDVFSQAHLSSLGFNPSYLGFVFAIFGAITAIVSFFISNIENKLGEKKSLYLVILIQGSILLTMAFLNSWIFLVAILLIFAINGDIALLLEESYNNKLIPSSQRASIISAIRFLHNGLFGGAIIIWLFGLSIDIIGGSLTLIMSGLIIIIIGLILLQIRKKIV